jgi:hypothetical protein
MGAALMVPVHLDALVLKTDRTVIEPMANFSRLPYVSNTGDVNSGIANISEEILSQPFQDRGFQLKAGVHLHWALPDGLTRGVRQGGQISFPAVPNRWLVTRTVKGQEGHKKWVVESDYLYPPGQGSEFSGISYPYSEKPTPENPKPNPQPFRYMGRVVPLAAWNPDNSSQDSSYLPKDHPLTVFGFYDNYDNQLPTDLSGVQYDVIGWYADASQDCLNSEAFKSTIAAVQARLKPDTTPDAVKYQALQEHYEWWLDQSKPPEPPNPFPERTVCYARLTFNVNPLDQSPSPEEKAVDVAVGNTSTEALSAYLAHRHIHAPAMAGQSEADCRIACSMLEDQLEFLHLAPRLEGRTLDLGLKFLEARHEKEFTAVSGGTIWTIRPETTAPVPAATGAANANETGGQEQVTLPLELAHLLNQLNLQQQAYDRDCDEIESMRKQLFADWYKYMLCAYPPQQHGDNYPDPDQTKYFIEKNSLFPLERRISKNNLLRCQCQQAVENLRQKVVGLAFPDKNTKYVLKAIAAPRYWLPNEPVVLVADETVQPTERHGQDGRLQEDGLLECQINEINGEITTNFDFETIRTAIEHINPHQSSRLLTRLNLSGKEQLNQKKLPTDLKDFLKSSNVTDGEIAGSTVSPEREFWLVKTGNREYRIWEEQGSLNVYQVKIGFYDWTDIPGIHFCWNGKLKSCPLKVNIWILSMSF